MILDHLTWKIFTTKGRCEEGTAKVSAGTKLFYTKRRIVECLYRLKAARQESVLSRLFKGSLKITFSSSCSMFGSKNDRIGSFYFEGPNGYFRHIESIYC